MFALVSQSTRPAPGTIRSPMPALRRARAEDATAVSHFLQGLSAASRQGRFHGGCNPRSPTLARHLCQVDGVRHQAWLAWVGRGDEAVVVGEARFVVGADDSADPADAELAMAVADGWQGRGVADALMRQVLSAAAAAGVRHLYGDVLDGNGRMESFMRRHGFMADGSAGAEVARLRRALSPQRATWFKHMNWTLSARLVAQMWTGRRTVAAVH